MDLLFTRYASPFPFCDGFISTCSFFDMVGNLLDKRNKEMNEETAWEFYLHKVFKDITFEEFLKSLKTQEVIKPMTPKSIETTITDSLDILKNFKAEGGE